MLNLASCLVCSAAAFQANLPAAARVAASGAKEASVVMADTLPYGNRFGLPFTREEFKRALQQIKPEAEAEFETRLIYEPDHEIIGIGISDLNLLLLAALSDDVAQRVIAFRPKLRDQVLRVRENPDFFIRAFGEGPPSQ